MGFTPTKGSPFIKDLLNNLPKHLIAYTITFIFLFILQSYFLNKDNIMSIIHSFLIASLVTL
jgi:hypothetical protein